MNELDSLGLPKSCVNISIVNGRGDGQFSAYNSQNLLLSIDRSWLAPSVVLPCVFLPVAYVPLKIIELNGYATPNSPNTISNQVKVSGKDFGEGLEVFTKNITYSLRNYMIGCIILNKIAALIAANCPACAPFVYANLPILKNSIAAASSIMMNARIYEHNTQNNFTTSFNLKTQPYDNCPGGLSNTMKAIANGNGGSWFQRDFIPVFSGKIVAHEDNHVFIPTLSGLGISDTVDLSLDIKTAIALNNSLTPFDDVYIPENDPPKNEMHVEVTEANLNFIMQQLRANDPIYNGYTVPNSLTLSQLNYNFGDRARKVLGSVYISNNGALHINGNMPLYYGVGTSTPFAGSYFKMRTKADCATHVVISDKGNFYIGSNNYAPAGSFANNNRADMHFLKGSIL
jgi:hypothetical protein